MTKISSSMKINSAQDDTSAYSISERMRVRLRSLKELAINAANYTNTDEDRATIQKEFLQRMYTINDIATTTAYNGKTLLDGTHAKQKIISDNILISAGDYTITADGVYSLADGYTGNITVNAKNVKLKQETPANQLSNVSIVTASGGNANLWIENLNIKNTEDKNIIKFQGADNYLTVKGTNILDDNNTSSHTNSAAINVGDGLTIVGNGSLEASSYNGAGIGGDCQDTAGYIKIGGAVTITATSTNAGAGIGSGYSASAGDITISNSATFNASSTHGDKVGKGHDNSTVGTISIGQTTFDVDVSVTTRENANIAIRVLDGALEYALDQATTIGAYLQRLEYTATNITTSTKNVQAAESTIRDADMAKEMTDYTKFNILTQASQSMLAQANQSSGAVLSLLG